MNPGGTISGTGADRPDGMFSILGYLRARIDAEPVWSSVVGHRCISIPLAACRDLIRLAEIRTSQEQTPGQEEWNILRRLYEAADGNNA